jgi:hypothetical protein
MPRRALRPEHISAVARSVYATRQASPVIGVMTLFPRLGELEGFKTT